MDRDGNLLWGAEALSTPGTAGSAVMTDTEIHISWFNVLVATGPLTGARIAQIAPSPDAVGTVAGKSYAIDGQGIGVDIATRQGVLGMNQRPQPGPAYWSIVDGAFVWVPEPATPGLLAVGALMVIRNKRKRR